MIKTRLKALRKQMKINKFDGYLVPSSDEYLSEYVPPHAKRLEYITGFTGSNGLVMILNNAALFFTDGRYITQSMQEIDSDIFQILDLQVLESLDWQQFINEDSIIAYDPKLFTVHHLQKFSMLNIKSHLINLIDEIWHDQPLLPSSVIYDYPLQYAGSHYLEKIRQCHELLQNYNAQSLVISDPMSVCWLLNIRASDVEFSPLLLANMIISHEGIYLFTEISRFEKELIRENITIIPSHEISKIIENIEGLILYDDKQCSSHLANIIKQKQSKSIDNPCSLWKACKNDVEIQYNKQGHIQDAIAICEMLGFIANTDISSLTEYDLGIKLTELRKKGQNYVYDSFPTICGYKENGAIIHYRAKMDTAKKIEGDGLLLIDSGGQYWGATTDITRTVSIGAPKEEYKKLYTKVLKGHIALAFAKFPAGKTSGANLDILARQYLWQDGQDYAHGTGHGVGSFLSVHEGPQNIHLKSHSAIFDVGMVVSNEPGYYVEGEFGIRIENLMFVKESGFKGFLEFEMLTLVPYAKELIDFSMLTRDEYLYLKTYYNIIERKILPLLSVPAGNWLREEIKLPLV